MGEIRMKWELAQAEVPTVLIWLAFPRGFSDWTVGIPLWGSGESTARPVKPLSKIERLVDLVRFEPSTASMRWKRAPGCAKFILTPKTLTPKSSSPFSGIRYLSAARQPDTVRLPGEPPPLFVVRRALRSSRARRVPLGSGTAKHTA